MKPLFTIITPSCVADYQRCLLLCESIDRLVKGDFEHCLIVEEGDLQTFQALRRGKRRLIARQSVIPDGMFLADRPNGWIMQQLIKLSAAEYAAADVMIFADSDIAFIKPFDLGDYVKGGMVDLFCEPAKGFDGPESGLKRSALRLLKLPSRRSGLQFVQPLTAWRRDVLCELQAYVECRWQVENWIPILAAEPRLSEYELYGKFVEEVLADTDRHHRTSDTSRCYCRWKRAFHGADEIEEFFASVPASAYAILIQSAIGLPVEAYRDQIYTKWQA